MSFSTKLNRLLVAYNTRRDIVKTLRDKDPIFEHLTFKRGPAVPQTALEFGLATGRSATASTAEALAGIGDDDKFTLTYGDDFVGIKLLDKDIEATRGDWFQIVDHVRREMDRAERTLINSVCETLYGDGSAYLGIVASVSTVTITLATPADARRFYKGMTLVFSNTATGALLDSGASRVVVSTNPAAGTVTVDSDASTISGLGAGDFIFASGDAANGSTLKKFKGFSAWIASAATVAAEGTFYGQTRTGYPLHLVAGTVSDQTAVGKSLKDKLVDGLETIWSNSNGQSKAVKMYMSGAKFAALSKEIESKEATGRLLESSFGHAMIEGVYGPLRCRIYPSTYVPEGRVLVINPESWAVQVLHLSEKPMGFMGTPGEGTRWERSGSSYSALMRAYLCLDVPAPSQHGWINLE